MAFQSPLISIPKKTTTDADWTNPVRSLIANSYGEDPKNYTEECAVLQRCRQDAVRGAGSDQTARDLLYKYFGQLELLELRFAEIKVSFAWNDAFTEKATTQSSLAFEKASIIHLLSSVLSSLAAGSSRADPEGLKRAYSNTRAAAGMLTYINDNFLHAPSTDLSREVVHFCIGVMTAQATEIFTEKLVDEKKSPALIARSAGSAGSAYGALVEEMKEFQGKGVFDRNWLHVLQIKAKLFASASQYYRSLADGQAGKHGAALVRLRIGDVSAQEASRLAGGFNYAFVATSTPSIPADAGTSLVEITKAHAALVKEAKDQASKDNDLIYHDILPSEASLPIIEKLPSAQPITIQELYQSPDVSKLIGPDIFARLVPLAVHESASVYSEEKAKLVRAEVERVDMSMGEVRAALEHVGYPGVVGQWRRLVDDDEASGGGGGDVDVGADVRRLAGEVQRGPNVEQELRGLERERERCERELRELSGLLDNESRECERARAKYTPHFTQSPSGPLTSHYRTNISSNLGSLQAAATSDNSVAQLWREIQPQLAILGTSSTQLDQIVRDIANGRPKPIVNDASGPSLLDLQDDESPSGGGGVEQQEKEQIRKAIQDASERLDRLHRVEKERDDVLKDLKEKIQNDDVSNLLLLNRRQQSVEPQLFATELEKFRPYQSRIASAISAAQGIVSELEMLVRQVERGKGAKERSRSQRDKSRRVKDWEREMREAGEKWSEVVAGLGKGSGFYDSLGVVVDELKREVRGFVAGRDGERGRLVGEIEMRQRIGGGGGGAGAGASKGLENQLSGLSLGGRGPTSPPLPPPRSSSSVSTNYPAFPGPPSTSHTPSFPPPPPPPQPSRQSHSLSPQTQTSNPNPYDLSSLSGPPSAFQTSPSPSQSPYPPGRSPYGAPQSPNHAPYPAPPSHTTSPPPGHSYGTSAYPSAPPPRPAPTGSASGSGSGSGSAYPSYAPPGLSFSSVGAQSPSSTGLAYPPPPPPPSQPPRQAQGPSGSYYPPPSGYTSPSLSPGSGGYSAYAPPASAQGGGYQSSAQSHYQVQQPHLPQPPPPPPPHQQQQQQYQQSYQPPPQAQHQQPQHQQSQAPSSYGSYPAPPGGGQGQQQGYNSGYGGYGYQR